MPDTFTPNYNLVMPGIGGDVNTWGTLLNSNFSIIDTGMAANLDLAGTRKMTGGLKIEMTNPSARFTDTSQTLPAGAWQWQSSGNVFELLRNTATAGNFSTSTVPIQFSATDGVTTLGSLTVGAGVSVTTGDVSVSAGNANFANGHGVFGKNAAGSVNVQLIKIGSDNNVDIQNGGASVRFLNQSYSVAVLQCDNVGNTAITGNFTANGNVTAFSDERLKCDWAALPDNFIEKLAHVKMGTYTRRDSGSRHAGSSAQDWLKLLPEVVETSADNGFHSLAYGNAALVSVIALARMVLDLKAEINAMRGDAK
ncbi:MAG TPA: tail fiber domain-containing protein [Gemmatimonadaceae bacterium]|nr:tail fiber domain-containing protein [Gemmatimonadaceae bacterium]